MAKTRSNEAFARRWNEEIWEERNLEAIDELVADEFVGHDPSLPEPIRGPEGVREIVEMLLSAFPDVQVDIEDIVTEGDWIAMRLTAAGTHEGEYMGLEPTGEEVEIVLTTFQRIENGRVVEEWQLVDRLGLLQQLGAVPERPPEV